MANETVSQNISPCFEASIVTAKGLSLLTKVILKGEPLRFTRAVIGSSIPENDLVTLTELPNEIPSHQTGESGTSATVDLQFCEAAEKQSAIARIFIQNGDTAFPLRTVGVIANDPDEGEILFAVTVDRSKNAAAFPSNKDGANVTLTVDLAFFVSNASKIDANITLPAEVTLAEFKAHTGDKENPHGVTAEQVGAVSLEEFNTLQARFNTLALRTLEIFSTLDVDVDVQTSEGSPGLDIGITDARLSSDSLDISGVKIEYRTDSKFYTESTDCVIYCIMTADGIFVGHDNVAPANAIATATAPTDTCTITLFSE